MLTRETLFLLFLLLEKLLFVSGQECVEPGVICSDDCSDVLLCIDFGDNLTAYVVETCSSGKLCDVDAQTCVAESLSSCTRTCSKPGLTCSDDCSEVIFCTEVGGELQGIVVEQCDNSSFCNADSGTCVAEENSSCFSNDFVFKCTSRGFYPDPFDCHKYYVCGKNPGEGTYPPEEGDSTSDPRNSCPDGYAYDYVSTICKDKNCRDPVLRHCERILQTESLEFLPSMYYICLKDEITNKIYPMLYRCPFGQYDNSSFTCE